MIVLPGEYVTPILIDGLSGDVGIFGYSGVTLNAGVERTTIVVQNKFREPVNVSFPRRAGLFVNSSVNLVLGGFTSSTGIPRQRDILRPSMVAVKNSPGFPIDPLALQRPSHESAADRYLRRLARREYQR